MEHSDMEQLWKRYGDLRHEAEAGVNADGLSLPYVGAGDDSLGS